MQKIAMLAAAAASVILPAPAGAQGKQDFQLRNSTGYDIAEVYVAPTSSDNWEEDVMGDDTLDNGERVTIHFPVKAKQCLYDIKVVWTDGDTAEWRKFDLCTVSRITLYWTNGEASADYE
jgi:hypothetical protein